MPAGSTHEQHMAQMKKDAEAKQHADVAMGFDQDKTTHHFTMGAEGGAIDVAANDGADEATIAQGAAAPSGDGRRLQAGRFRQAPGHA